MAKNKFKYRVDNGTMDDDDSHEFESNFDSSDGEWVAEAAAEDFHSKHDGWDASWPITIVIMNADGSVIGTFSVERENVPQFLATEIEESER